MTEIGSNTVETGVRLPCPPSDRGYAGPGGPDVPKSNRLWNRWFSRLSERTRGPVAVGGGLLV